MMLAGEDKLHHILACALITMVVFSVLVVLQKYCSDNDIQTCSCRSNDNVSIGSGSGDVDAAVVFSHRDTARKYFIIAIISGVISMLVGVAKEIADAYNILWTGGQSSWGDIIADFIGVVIGFMVIFLALGLRYWCLHRHES